MSLLSGLAGFGIRQVVGETAGDVVHVVERYFRDHSLTLPRALARAHDRAWRALGVALAGDGFLDRVKVFFASGEDKGIREQVRLFLGSNASSLDKTPAGLRQLCLGELKQLLKSDLLAAPHLAPEEAARQAAAFQRYADPQGLIDGARQAVDQVATVLAPQYPNLSQLLRIPTPGGPPLLAALFAYFLRREIETDEELAHGLFFDGLRQLSAAGARGFAEVNKALVTLGGQFAVVFEQLDRIEVGVQEVQATAAATHGAVLDLQGEVQRLAGRQFAGGEEVRGLLQEVLARLGTAGMQQGEVRPRDSFSINSEDERQAVKALLNRFRQLPAEGRQQVPALLNGLGKLQLGAGDFGGATQTFTEVARTVEDPQGKAEACFNAYRAALEARKWEEALPALREAASLQPQRFAPFPFGRYQPRRILGAGGFGTAFLCHDANFGEDVVIKTLHTADLARGLNDVFREARILRQLSHPAIIGARDCEYADAAGKERPYLVMEYFPGRTLEQFIDEQGTLTPAQLLRMGERLAVGMQAAHGQHVLHRDLKPTNVLVRNEADYWQVKVIDFGLALRQQTIETSVAARAPGTTVLGGSVAGTLKYAPPEQLGEYRGVQPGPYSDVYAFGKLCCYALFKTTEPTRRQWATIPEPLANVLDRCVEQGLEHRYPDFKPVVQALLSLVSGGSETSSGKRRGARKASDQSDTVAPGSPGKEMPSQAPKQLEAYYKEVRDRHGMRPRAIQVLQDGHDPSSVRTRYGSWLQFVKAMGDLSEGQKGLQRELGDFLRVVETTRMTKSFKMLTLQAMLNCKALPGSIGIAALAVEFRRLAKASAVLLAEVSEDVEDTEKLCRYLERNPIAAWTGGKGSTGKPYFTYDGGTVSAAFAVPDTLRPEFHELVREVIEWRLAAYLR